MISGTIITHSSGRTPTDAKIRECRVRAMASLLDVLAAIITNGDEFFHEYSMRDNGRTQAVKSGLA